MEEVVIKVTNLKKKYKLGSIGGGTLTEELQSRWALMRGKEDPNAQIGQEGNRGKEFWALKGVSFEVKKGEAVGIIGLNGAGKSTLLKILSRITAPTEGEVDIKGRISSMLEVGTGFHGELTGRENIYLNGAILGMRRNEVDEKIDDIIRFSECTEFIDTPVKRYSSGMYVKLAFSVAAHLNSEILIMDEVLAVGDVKFQQKCLNKMKQLVEEGRTVLYVSHNMGTIKSLCDRCIVLKKGEVLFDGEVNGAIKVYFDSETHCNLIETNLENLVRPSHSTNMVRMYKTVILNKKSSIFYRDENLNFDLYWTALDDIQNVRFRFMLKKDGEAIGATISRSIDGVSKGQDRVTRIKFPLKNLQPGEFTASIALFYMNDFGEQCLLDHVNKAINFEIIYNDTKEQKDLKWDVVSWGYVNFDDLQIDDISEGC